VDQQMEQANIQGRFDLDQAFGELVVLLYDRHLELLQATLYPM